jgi:hypothetical protein
MRIETKVPKNKVFKPQVPKRSLTPSKKKKKKKKKKKEKSKPLKHRRACGGCREEWKVAERSIEAEKGGGAVRRRVG